MASYQEEADHMHLEEEEFLEIKVEVLGMGTYQSEVKIPEADASRERSGVEEEDRMVESEDRAEIEDLGEIEVVAVGVCSFSLAC